MTPKKWVCKHNSCLDIDCTTPIPGYYKYYLDNTNKTNFVFKEIPRGNYWKNDTLNSLAEDSYFDGNEVRPLPEMYYYDPVKNDKVMFPYYKPNKSRCAKRRWSNEENRYVCTKYRCYQCYNCDEATGQCKDTAASKLACAAKKYLGKKVPECNMRVSHPII